MSDTAVQPAQAPRSFDLEELEPSPPPPADAAEQLLAAATAEAGRIREQASAEGYAEGRAAGHQAGAAEVLDAMRALQQALAEVRALGADVADSIERDAIELALELAQKILAGALQASPELVVEVVQGAMRRVADRRRITVLVNPGDLEAVTAALGDSAFDGAQRARSDGLERDLQPDPSVPRGGAVVRTAEGELDATVEVQLERAREVIEAELAGEERAP